MSEPPYRILIVDDEESARRQISRFLREGLKKESLKKSGGRKDAVGVSVDEALTIPDAQAVLTESLKSPEPGYDLVIIDQKIALADASASTETNGTTLLRWMVDPQNRLEADAIMLTGNPSPELEESVLELGAYAYANKADVIRTAHKQGEHARSFLFHVLNCIQRKRLRQKRLQVLKAVGDLHKRWSNTRNFEERFKAIVESIPEIHSAAHKVTIRVRTADGKEHQRVACWGGDAPGQTNKLGVDEGITGLVFRTGKPIRVNDVAGRPEYVATSAETRSELCVPVFGQPKGTVREVIAVINLEGRQLNGFTEEDERTLVLIAEVASLVILDVQWLTAMFEMAAGLNEAARPVELSEFGAEAHLQSLAALTIPQVEPLFQKLLDGALQLTNGKFGGAFLADRKNKVLRRIVQQGMADEHLQRTNEIPFDDRRFVVALAYRTKTSILATGAQKEEAELWRVYQPFFHGQNAKSFLCVPMRLGQDVLGVIDIESHEVSQFNELEKQVVEAFAAMAATALANFALSVAIRAKIGESLKSELISLAVHEVLGPVGKSMQEIEHCHLLYKEGRIDNLGPRLERTVKKLKDASSQLRKTLEEVAASADGRSHTIESFDLSALLVGQIGEARVRYPAVNFTVAGADVRRHVKGNVIGVTRVVNELFENVSKYCTHERTANLQIDVESKNSGIQVTFSDDGPGIPEGKRSSLFSPPAISSNGGFGLNKCRCMVELCDGRLDLDFEKSPGCSFRLWLPAVESQQSERPA